MKWKAYPAYKDLNLGWLGKIPEHWNSQKIKYTSYIKGRIGWQNLRSDEFIDEGPYLVTGMHFDNGDVNWDACYHISDSRYLMAPEIFVREGDVLITKDGSIGKLAHIKNLPGRASLNSHLLIIRPLINGYESRFMYHLLGSEVFRHFVLTEQKGTTFYGITQESIENFPALLPPRHEQQIISTFLDRETERIDTLIAKKEHQIKLLQEKRAALISHVVTKGLDPNAKMKDSGIEWIGKIPQHWGQKSVKYMTHILRGKFTHRPRNDPRMYDGPYPFIQTGDVAAASKYIKEYHQTLSEDGFAVSKMFPRGTLVMTIAANIGDMAILDFEACFPDSIVGFVPKHDVALDYLYYLFIGIRPALLNTATLNTQLNINIDRIGSIVAPQPPFREQKKIVEKLDVQVEKMNQLVAQVNASITMLRIYRTALISAAVTGKIDVRKEAA